MYSSLTSQFWEQFRRVSCYPHSCGCESFSDGLILQPLNTFSNILLFILGAFLTKKYKDEKNEFFILGLLVLYAAISSTVFHMSFIYFSLLMDFTGIALLNFWVLYVVIVKTNKQLISLLTLSYIMTLILILIYEPMKYIVPFTTALITAIVYITKHKNKEIDLIQKNLLLSVCILVIGVTMFELDNFKIYCPPLGLHTLWHLIIPISIYQFYLFISKSKKAKKLQT